jgi:hypothetical protein
MKDNGVLRWTTMKRELKHVTDLRKLIKSAEQGKRLIILEVAELRLMIQSKLIVNVFAATMDFGYQTEFLTVSKARYVLWQWYWSRYL